MASYVSTATLNTDPEDPLTSELLTALKDNPTAIAEGASGAPRVVPAALGTFIGRGSSASGASTLLTVTDLEDVGFILLFCDLSVSGGGSSSATGRIKYEVSTDNGSTFSGAVAIVEVFAPEGTTESVSGLTALIELTGSENAVRFSAEILFGVGSIGATKVVAIGVGRKA